MNAYKYKVASCPICNQGWVEIVKDKTAGKLFVCCRECESEWDSPESITNRDLATHDTFGQITEPEYDEIMQRGWGKYIIK